MTLEILERPGTERRVPETDWVYEDEKEYKSAKVHKNSSIGMHRPCHIVSAPAPAGAEVRGRCGGGRFHR